MQKKSYSIVGTNHTGKEAFVESLKPGTPAVLVREPTNRFDPLAVAVYIDGHRVGYIPRQQNRVLAGFIDETGQSWEQPAALAQDGKDAAAVVHPKTIPATFIRSPNSSFPLVEV
jgi:hypothetical protein